jgi:hypothetical protein
MSTKMEPTPLFKDLDRYELESESPASGTLDQHKAADGDLGR